MEIYGALAGGSRFAGVAAIRISVFMGTLRAKAIRGIAEALKDAARAIAPQLGFIPLKMKAAS